MADPVAAVESGRPAAPVEEKRTESTTASSSDKPVVENTEDVRVSEEYRGHRDESVMGNFRFLWVTLLVGCALLEVSFTYVSCSPSSH